MSLTNSSLLHGGLEGSRARSEAQALRRELRQIVGAARSLVSFVTDEHLTLATFQGAWAQEARATLTVRAVGQSLGVELPEIAANVRDLVAGSGERSLLEFQAGDAALLFSLIDEIAPDEFAVGDGRSAAEKFQYAAEARSALLAYALSALNQRYIAPAFGSLAEATAWTRAFAALLQDAEQVITGTQQLLYDEATAVQSYLDTLHNRFEMTEARARFALLPVRSDWPRLLESVEAEILDRLSERHDRLQALALGELRDARDSGWLQSLVRNTPLLGSLLLAVAGGAAMIAPTVGRATTGALTAIDGESIARVRQFPILPRSWDGRIAAAPVAPQDEVAAFFRAEPRPAGRQSLTIPDSGTFERVLDELVPHGYARRSVLKLYGLDSVTALDGPLTMDVRWSQGGRPLLLPPFDLTTAAAPAAPVAAESAPLPEVLDRFGFTLEQVAAANPDLDLGRLETGQTVTLPAQSWTSQRSPGSETIRWGASLAQIAGVIGVPAERLADLNDIAAPESWLYMGHPLRLPLRTGPGAPSVAARPVPEPASVEFTGESRPVSTLLVHQVAAGESLDGLAARYGTTVMQLMQDNRISGEPLGAGQVLLVRAPTGIEPSGAATRPDLASRGAFPTTPPLPARTRPADDSGASLVTAYGGQLFGSVDEMPPEVRSYFTSTVQEVADFFNVRPGDLIGILQAENNNAGLRIGQPVVSSAGARGVAQVIPRTWNGWQHPEVAQHITDLRQIEEHGGIGFDWSLREEWREWVSGSSDGAALATSNADPDRFENSVAAIARHLVQWELTRDRAALDPGAFDTRLADAISVYNSGQVLSAAAEFRQSAANHKTTAQYVREAMAVSSQTPSDLTAARDRIPLEREVRRQMDARLGVEIGDEELSRWLDESPVADEVAAGRLDPESGAVALVESKLASFVEAGRLAREAGSPLPWPYVFDEATLAGQQLAVEFLGRTLTAPEIEALAAAHGGSLDGMRRAVQSRPDARLFAGSRRLMDDALRREARGLPLARHEVARVLQPILAGRDPGRMGDAELSAALDEVRAAISRLPEYVQLRAGQGFSETPLSPMPPLTREFHAPVNYQRGGLHTGIDVRLPANGNGEPPLYAVEDGRVVHVGPLYCAASDACRGDHAIVLDHGGDVYSIYSHNSSAEVEPGQTVTAGQVIGRQGNEGYSFGSHLHFEVHTGAPFSGDWQEPFHGGQFEDPERWLPDH